MSSINSLVSQTSLPSSESYPSVSDFFNFYRDRKNSRVYIENTHGPRHAVKNTELIRLNDSCNYQANLATGNILFLLLCSESNLRVKNVHWEYSVDKNSKNYDETKLNDLIVTAGGLDKIPSYILDQSYELELVKFYKTYSYLGGSTISLRIDNDTEFGLYFCIPFAALKIGYYASFFEKCEVVIPNFPHEKKVNNTPYIQKYSCEELEQFIKKYRNTASVVLESRYLP